MESNIVLYTHFTQVGHSNYLLIPKKEMAKVDYRKHYKIQLKITEVE